MVAVRVNIKIRKYLWSEFFHDVATMIIIANALSKRYLKRSIPDIFQSAEYFLKSAVLFLALFISGVVSLAVTFGIPIVLLLAALGKIS